MPGDLRRGVNSRQMAELEKETLSELLNALGHAMPVVRLKSARALGKLGPTGNEAYRKIWIACHDPEQSVREVAVQAMAGFGSQGVAALAQLLAHSCKYVRRNAAWGLGKIGPDASGALPQLCQALKDADPRAATGAAQALGMIGPEAREAVPALAEAMRGTNVVLCRMASKALSQIGEAALSTLVAHLKHHDPFVRGEAAVALGWMGPSAAGAVPALLESLEKYTPRARTHGAAKVALGGSQAVTPVAVSAETAAGDEMAMLQLITALGRVGPMARPSLLFLQSLHTDDRQTIRHAISNAVRQIEGDF